MAYDKKGYYWERPSDEELMKGLESKGLESPRDYTAFDIARKEFIDACDFVRGEKFPLMVYTASDIEKAHLHDLLERLEENAPDTGVRIPEELRSTLTNLMSDQRSRVVKQIKSEMIDCQHAVSNQNVTDMEFC